MKKLVFFTLFLISLGLFAQSKTDLQGAYLLEKDGVKKLWIFVDGYSSLTEYTESEYIQSKGGPFIITGNSLTITLEFNDKNPETVGDYISYPIQWHENYFMDELGNKWIKQTPISQELDGAWKITARKQNGEMREIHQTGERKTIKLLVDGYFQWFAIDPSQKSFSGTGGGLYFFKKDVYTEKIHFFSRDNARVGTSLEFEGEIQNGKWHHSGLSSKGELIYEIWTKIN